MSSPGDLALLDNNAKSPASLENVHSSSSSTTHSPQAPLDAPANSSRNPSYSRALVPQQPRHNGSAASLPSVATASLFHDDGGPSPVGAGPMKKVYDIPPRPKPGRKPATDEPQSKRKAQNRESQRAFRARKAQKVQELTHQVESVQQQYKDEVNALTVEVDQWQRRAQELQEQISHLLADRDYWKQQHDNLKNATSSPHSAPLMAFNAHMPETSFDPMLTTANTRHDEEHVPTSNADYTGSNAPNAEPDCSTCGPDNCACMDAVMRDSMQVPPFMEAVPLKRRGDATPMQGIEKSDSPTCDPEEHEIDFTAKFARPAVDTLMEGEHETCGFCTNPDNCFCRDPSLQVQAEALSNVSSGEATNNVLPPILLGPGSCEQCQADPKMRAWCQGVARLRADPTPPSSRRSSGIGKTLETMEPKVESKIDNFSQVLSLIPGASSIGCSEAYKLLDGRVSMDANDSDIRRLRPIPPQSFDARRDTFASMEPGTYSAMEVDVGSILTTLQHSRGPLKPRPSDGRNANLITKAEEMRRASGSPYVSSPLQKEVRTITALDLSS